MMKLIGTYVLSIMLIASLIGMNHPPIAIVVAENSATRLHQAIEWSGDWSLGIIAGRITTPWSWNQPIEFRSFSDSKYFHLAWRVTDTPFDSSSLYYSRLNLATGRWDIQSYKVGNDVSSDFAIAGNEEYLWFAWVSETNRTEMIYRIWILSTNKVTNQTSIGFEGELSNLQVAATQEVAVMVIQNETELLAASFKPEFRDSSIEKLFEANSFALFVNNTDASLAYFTKKGDLLIRNLLGGGEVSLGSKKEGLLFQASSLQGFVIAYLNQNEWVIELYSGNLGLVSTLKTLEPPSEISAYLEINATDFSVSTWGMEIRMENKGVIFFENSTIEIPILSESLLVMKKTYPIIVYSQSTVYTRVWGINDTDSDSLPDWYEQWIGGDPNKGDTDGDLIPDPLEAKYTLKINVKDALEDLDADTLTNSEEIALGTDPYMADTDLDFLSDSLEAKDSLLSPTNHSDGFLDFDSDGLVNYLEFYVGTNYTLPDSDGDGLLDGEEYFMGTNPLVPDGFRDLDGDGLSSYWEVALKLSPNFENSGKYQGGDTILLTWFYLGVTFIGLVFGTVKVMFSERKSKSKELKLRNDS